MGLNSMNSMIVVKEEAVEGCKDSAFFKNSPVQWPLSNTFDPSNKLQAGEIKKTMNENRQGSNHLYPGQQQNVHSMLLPNDVKMVPRTNQAVSVNMSNPFFKTHFAGGSSGGSQNFAGAPTMKQQQSLGGIPVTAPHSVLPSGASMPGTTEPWFNSKASRAPAQLTIFYGGTVNVFDAISPEKAQAIMFLAGNGSLGACNIAQTRAQVQAAPTSKPGAEDVVYVNQPINTPPCSALSSPMSVSSHPVGQSGGGPTNIEAPARTTAAPISKVDAPKIATSMGHVTATTMIPSAVPQARKASLARFLEKRKERAMNSAPYNPSKNSVEGAANPGGSNGVSFSASSGPVNAGNS